MGFFSWLTADTQESIANHNTDRCRTVYLLRPDGQPPIEEKSYGGYGIFGDTSAYSWLAMNNFNETERHALFTVKANDMYGLGIDLDLGTYYEHADGLKWGFCGKPYVGVSRFEGEAATYETPQPRYGNKTPNELIASGEWIEHPLRELLLRNKKYKPLKFSFNKDAVYEELPPSKNCPCQGFFYASACEEEEMAVLCE